MKKALCAFISLILMTSVFAGCHGPRGLEAFRMPETFDTSKNLMMKSLSTALLYSFQGKLDELAKEQQADLTQESDKDKNVVVTLTAKVKKVRGYSKIQVFYKPDGTVFKMQMDEFNGASTLYTLN